VTVEQRCLVAIRRQSLEWQVERRRSENGDDRQSWEQWSGGFWSSGMCGGVGSSRLSCGFWCSRMHGGVGAVGRAADLVFEVSGGGGGSSETSGGV